LRQQTRKRAASKTPEPGPNVENSTLQDLVKKVIAHRIRQLERIIPDVTETEEASKIVRKVEREKEMTKEVMGALLPILQKNCGPPQPKRSRVEELREELDDTRNVVQTLNRNYDVLKRELMIAEAAEKAAEQERAIKARIAEKEKVAAELVAAKKAELAKKVQETQREVEAALSAAQRKAEKKYQTLKKTGRVNLNDTTSSADMPVSPPPLTQRKGPLTSSTPNMSPIYPPVGVRKLGGPDPKDAIPEVVELDEPMDTQQPERNESMDMSVMLEQTRDSVSSQKIADAFAKGCNTTEKVNTTGPIGNILPLLGVQTYADVLQGAAVNRGPTTITSGSSSITVHDPVPTGSAESSTTTPRRPSRPPTPFPEHAANPNAINAPPIVVGDVDDLIAANHTDVTVQIDGPSDDDSLLAGAWADVHQGTRKS